MTTIQQMFFCSTSTYYSPYMDQAGDLFDFTSFTFTNGGATGRDGPTSFSGDAAYTSQAWYSTYFSVSAGIQYWYAPATGNYKIRAAGAAGHNGYYSSRCRGIIIESIATLTKGMLYKIMIGQKGSVHSNGSGGGGGGTFLTEYFNVPIIISGGGAGSWLTNSNWNYYVGNSNGQSGTSGAYSACNTGEGGNGGNGGTGSSNGYGGGGGGLYGDGTAAKYAADFGYSGLGLSFFNGGTGGNTATNAFGGFGGGGGTHGNTGGGGGGGGYSGGGGSDQSFQQNVGGGGGSYSQTAITEIGYNQGNGYLIITKNP